MWSSQLAFVRRWGRGCERGRSRMRYFRAERVEKGYARYYLYVHGHFNRIPLNGINSQMGLIFGHWIFYPPTIQSLVRPLLLSITSMHTHFIPSSVLWTLWVLQCFMNSPVLQSDYYSTDRQIDRLSSRWRICRAKKLNCWMDSYSGTSREEMNVNSWGIIN